MNSSDNNSKRDDQLELAASKAAERARQHKIDPEPSLGRRLSQIGILGWLIILPILLAAWIGHRLDLWLSTGVFFSAACLLTGAALGLWFAWRWMHNQ